MCSKTHMWARVVSQTCMCTRMCSIFSLFSNSTTLSYTTDTILPGLGCASGDHSGGFGRKAVHLACGLFLMYPARCLIAKPYANSSELSYTTTLCYTTDTILPGLGYPSGDHFGGVLRTLLCSAGKQSTTGNRPSVCGPFLLYPARCLIVRPYADSSEFSYTTTISCCTM